MSALLRSGKFLRLVSGFARQQQNSFPPPPSAQGGGASAAHSALPTVAPDPSAAFHSWSLQNLQCTLPAATALGEEHDGDDHRQADEVDEADSDSPVTKAEIESLLSRLEDCPSSASSHTQSVAALRLCGFLLAGDVSKGSERSKFANEVWTRLEEEFRIVMTVDHYNALLAVYMENGHAFCPEAIQSRIRKNCVKPNKETFRMLLERYCQEGNMDGANAMLKALFEEHRGLPTPKDDDERLLPEHSSVEQEKALPNSSKVGRLLQTVAAPALPEQLSRPESSNDNSSEPSRPESAIDYPTPSALSPQPQLMQAVPLVQVFNPQTQSLQYCPLPDVCLTFRSQGRYWDLENLLATSAGSYTPDDRRSIFLFTLQTYADQGLYDKALMLNEQLHQEGLSRDFASFHELMSHLAETYSSVYSEPVLYTSEERQLPEPRRQPQRRRRQEEVPSDAASVEHQQSMRSVHHKTLKRALNDKDVDAAYKAFVLLDKTGKQLNVTESSTLIELLVKGEHVEEGARLAEDMLKRDTYPMPKIFRFLLNKLAANGNVELMTRVGSHLSPKVKKEVSFDNRLCNAYLSAGMAHEFLQLLEQEIDELTENKKSDESLQALKDKFPRGGAMGLLESNRHLIGDYSRVALKFLHRLNYVAPVNVLWTYHFINGDEEKATKLWQDYVKDCPQIMFQKICQTARSRGDAAMANRLVRLLQSARVTSGAQGIAYSCLLDVLVGRGEYEQAMGHLKAGLKQGVRLEDINRTALVRLKTGLEEKLTEEFPFPIPKKSKERSLVVQEE